MENYGMVEIEGKEIELVGDADWYTNDNFSAVGIDDENNFYLITWEPRQEWLDSGDNDASSACDWDNPDKIEKIENEDLWSYTNFIEVEEVRKMVDSSNF